MKIVVTGGAGFIGSHVVDACLAAEHDVVVIDDLSSGSRANIPESVRLFVADICDSDRIYDIFDEIRPDAVCHQAAHISVSRSVREPVVDARVNILGLLNVCTNAAHFGVRRIVFASSGGVLYGDVSVPARETVPENPITPYGISKWTCEQYLKFFAREHGIEAVALRYSNVYGPRQNPHGEAGVVAIFCQRLLNNESATINGDGKYRRDYVFGPDIARANLLALIANVPPGFTALNVGTGIATSVIEVAQMIRAEVMAIKRKTDGEVAIPELVYGPARQGDLRSSVLDANLAARLIGWRPSTTLSIGIAETVEWFLVNQVRA